MDPAKQTASKVAQKRHACAPFGREGAHMMERDIKTADMKVGGLQQYMRRV